MADTSDETASPGGILADIAALARKLAETEPCKSASGPEALRALAARLDGMLTAQPAIVSVAMLPSAHLGKIRSQALC